VLSDHKINPDGIYLNYSAEVTIGILANPFSIEYMTQLMQSPRLKFFNSIEHREN
jgi:hypothetical protein